MIQKSVADAGEGLGIQVGPPKCQHVGVVGANFQQKYSISGEKNRASRSFVDVEPVLKIMNSCASRPSSTWPSIISLQLIEISLFLMLPSIGSIRCPIPSVSDQGRRECRGRREEGQEAPKTCKALATHPIIFRKEGLLKYLSSCSGLEAGDLPSLEQPLKVSCFCWIGAPAGL